jgi:hypothetical protein
MPHVIDGFTKDPHFKTLAPGAPQDIYSAPARETIFSIGGGDSWDQPIALDIGPRHGKGISIGPHHGKGILIVNSGFGATAGLLVNYGTFRQQGGAPLGLNLSAYSAFQLEFQGFATSGSMNVTIEVSGQGGPNWAFERAPIPINDNPFSLDFPFSGFTDNHVDFGLPQSVLSDIAGLFIEFEPDPEASFGITSFLAL